MTGWVWKHFSPQEVLSPDGLRIYEAGGMPLSPLLLDRLEILRSAVKAPILINHNGLKLRGYRSKVENAGIAGSAPNSYHCRGLAADLTCHSMPIEEFRALIHRLDLFRGIGFYPNRNFIHVDIRLGPPAHWTHS